MSRAGKIAALTVALLIVGAVAFVLGQAHQPVAVAQEAEEAEETGEMGEALGDAMGAALMGPILGMMGQAMPGGGSSVMGIDGDHVYIVSGGVLTKVNLDTLEIVGKLQLETPDEAKQRMMGFFQAFEDEEAGDE